MISEMGTRCTQVCCSLWHMYFGCSVELYFPHRHGCTAPSASTMQLAWTLASFGSSRANRISNVPRKNMQSNHVCSAGNQFPLPNVPQTVATMERWVTFTQLPQSATSRITSHNSLNNCLRRRSLTALASDLPIIFQSLRRSPKRNVQLREGRSCAGCCEWVRVVMHRAKSCKEDFPTLGTKAGYLEPCT